MPSIAALIILVREIAVSGLREFMAGLQVSVPVSALAKWKTVAQDTAWKDYAARNADEMLYNSYRMGKNSIERGSKDYWTLSPKRVDQINAAARGGDTSTAQRGGRGWWRSRY